MQNLWNQKLSTNKNLQNTKSSPLLSKSTLVLFSIWVMTLLNACNQSPTSLENPTPNNSAIQDTTTVDSIPLDTISLDTIQLDTIPSDSIPKDTSIDTTSIATPLPISGFFTQTDVKVSGSYEIQKHGDKIGITLSQDFANDSGPDLYLVLVKRKASTLGTYDYNSIPLTDKIVLGDIIQSGAGTLREIPLSEKELQEYHAVMFQCVLWNHTYAIAPIDWP